MREEVLELLWRETQCMGDKITRFVEIEGNGEILQATVEASNYYTDYPDFRVKPETLKLILHSEMFGIDFDASHDLFINGDKRNIAIEKLETKAINEWIEDNQIKDGPDRLEDSDYYLNDKFRH